MFKGNLRDAKHLHLEYDVMVVCQVDFSGFTLEITCRFKQWRLAHTVGFKYDDEVMLPVLEVKKK